MVALQLAGEELQAVVGGTELLGELGQVRTAAEALVHVDQRSPQYSGRVGRIDEHRTR
ncbi:hypothetical protein ACFSKW_44775 [Nonomuraea mangrovi]|uniref:Uncharacterized protein n=1 Tax=Nonomuraea mangrovi TaxID=2316207 RepID=A0ABW4TA79_9ACTN